MVTFVKKRINLITIHNDCYELNNIKNIQKCDGVITIKWVNYMGRIYMYFHADDNNQLRNINIKLTEFTNVHILNIDQMQELIEEYTKIISINIINPSILIIFNVCSCSDKSAINIGSDIRYNSDFLDTCESLLPIFELIQNKNKNIKFKFQILLNLSSFTLERSEFNYKPNVTFNIIKNNISGFRNYLNNGEYKSEYLYELRKKIVKSIQKHYNNTNHLSKNYIINDNFNKIQGYPYKKYLCNYELLDYNHYRDRCCYSSFEPKVEFYNIFRAMTLKMYKHILQSVNLNYICSHNPYLIKIIYLLYINGLPLELIYIFIHYFMVVNS